MVPVPPGVGCAGIMFPDCVHLENIPGRAKVNKNAFQDRRLLHLKKRNYVTDSIQLSRCFWMFFKCNTLGIRKIHLATYIYKDMK